MTSPDGITWTARTAAEANAWYSIAYGNGLFVAVADNGTNCFMTSSDGIAWTAPIAAEACGWNSITYGNGLFVAVALSGTKRVIISTATSVDLFFNGTTTQTLSGDLSFASASTVPTMNFSGSGAKTFNVSATTTDFTIVTSSGVVTAGTNLTVINNFTNSSSSVAFTAPTNLYLSGTATTSNQVISGTWNGAPNLYVTGAGIKTLQTNATATLISVAASSTLETPEQLTVLGDYTNSGVTAPVWTARTAAELNSWLSITYGNGLFVAVSTDGTNRVMTSPDGITWAARMAAETSQFMVSPSPTATASL
jgi:hypothetical protein